MIDFLHQAIVSTVRSTAVAAASSTAGSITLAASIIAAATRTTALGIFVKVQITTATNLGFLLVVSTAVLAGSSTNTRSLATAATGLFLAQSTIDHVLGGGLAAATSTGPDRLFSTGCRPGHHAGESNTEGQEQDGSNYKGSQEQYQHQESHLAQLAEPLFEIASVQTKAVECVPRKRGHMSNRFTQFPFQCGL
jgi:hypothetical protein